MRKMDAVSLAALKELDNRIERCVCGRHVAVDSKVLSSCVV
jgi:hypothetical protein